MNDKEKILKWCDNTDPWEFSRIITGGPCLPLDMNFLFRWVVPKLAVRQPDPLLKAIEPKAPSYLLHSLRFIYHGKPVKVQLLIEWVMEGTKYDQGMLRQLLGSPCQDEEHAWQDAILKLTDAEVKP